MQEHIARWDTLIAAEKPTAELLKALWFVAYTLSSLTKQTLSATRRRITSMPIADLDILAGDTQAETVGIYILLGDDLPGQAILMLGRQAALRLADLMQDLRPGTTTQLGEVERSALGELGNVAAASFLNIVAQPAWGALRPSPPAVMVGTLEAVLGSIVVLKATAADTLRIIDAEFQDAARSCSMQLWIIPTSS
jgi:chemotaxis protein CheC